MNKIGSPLFLHDAGGAILSDIPDDESKIMMTIEIHWYEILSQKCDRAGGAIEKPAARSLILANTASEMPSISNAGSMPDVR